MCGVTLEVSRMLEMHGSLQQHSTLVIDIFFLNIRSSRVIPDLLLSDTPKVKRQSEVPR